MSDVSTDLTLAPPWLIVTRRVRRGVIEEEDAAATLYRELAPAVLGYLRSQRAPEPEDLLGEVFLQSPATSTVSTGTPTPDVAGSSRSPITGSSTRGVVERPDQ